jgi:hypothetical protein
MNPVDQDDKARDLQGQAARTRHLGQLAYGRRCEDWPDLLRDPREPAQDELALLQSQVAGHHCDGWCRLTGDEDYFAACSCGWRSTETRDLSPMLYQVKDHLDTVRQAHGGDPATQAPARDKSGRDNGQREMRPRELRTPMQGQQGRLSRTLQHSTDLLSASADHADRLVAELQHGEWAKTSGCAPAAETVQHKVERANELRKAIVAAAGALAVIAEEIAWIHQDLDNPRPGDSAAPHQLAGDVSETAGTARDAQHTTGHWS